MARVTEAHVEARRSQILDAAWACFAEKGYHQTTMQDIAVMAELSAGTLYLYFEGKEAILKGISDRSQEMGRALVAGARSRVGDPLDALRIVGETMVSVFNDPTFEVTTRVNMEIMPEVIRNEELRKSFAKELTFWHTAVTQLLSEAKEKGELRPEVDPSSLAAMMICAWDGLRHFRLIDPDTFKPEQLVTLIQVLVTDEGAARAIKFAIDESQGRERPLSPPYSTPRPEE